MTRTNFLQLQPSIRLVQARATSKYLTLERAAKTLHRMSPCTPLRVPAKITWLLPALYVISMEDAKLHNLSVEPVFFFCELQSIRQSFASFVYKIKQIEAERYHQIPTNSSDFEAKMSEQSIWGAVSINHCCSKRVAADQRVVTFETAFSYTMKTVLGYYCTMQFIGCDSIQTCSFVSKRFQSRTMINREFKTISQTNRTV